MFLDSPSGREEGKGLFLALLVPTGLFSAALSALSTPGCAGSAFQLPQGWVPFPWCVFMAHGHRVPSCAGARVRLWLQPGRKEASGASASGSLVAPGPVELFAEADLQAWGVCSVCFSFFGNQALHKSLKELPLVWRGQAGSSCMVVFLFTTCSITPPNTSAPVSVPAGTILVLEHESPFVTNCCHVRLLNSSV